MLSFGRSEIFFQRFQSFFSHKKTGCRACREQRGENAARRRLIETKEQHGQRGENQRSRTGAKSKFFGGLFLRSFKLGLLCFERVQLLFQLGLPLKNNLFESRRLRVLPLFFQRFELRVEGF